MKLNKNLLGAVAVLFTLICASSVMAAIEKSGTENWVDFYVNNSIGAGNAQTWSFDRNSVEDRHGVTLVEVRGTALKPFIQPPFADMVSQTMIVGIDCTRGWYMSGAVEYVSASGKTVKRDADPEARWQNMEGSIFMRMLARKAC